MKKRTFLLAIVALITACTQPPVTTVAPPPTATSEPPAPTQTVVPLTATPVPLSRLRVVGNEIQNENGEVVVLRGVAIADPAILYLEGHWTATDYEILADEWEAKIIRVPIHPSTWEHEPDYADKYLDPIVEWGESFGL